jgi:hypothetical protein
MTVSATTAGGLLKIYQAVIPGLTLHGFVPPSGPLRRAEWVGHTTFLHPVALCPVNLLPPPRRRIRLFDSAKSDGSDRLPFTCNQEKLTEEEF